MKEKRGGGRARETRRRDHRLIFLCSGLLLQPQSVGDTRGNVPEADRGARDPLKSHAVHGETRQLAHLHLPLDTGVRRGVTVSTDEQEGLGLFVLAVLLSKDLLNLSEHHSGVLVRGGLHGPGESEAARFRLLNHSGGGGMLVIARVYARGGCVDPVRGRIDEAIVGGVGARVGLDGGIFAGVSTTNGGVGVGGV